MPAGPGRQLRAGDRAQAAAPPGLDRPDRAVADRPGVDDRGDLGALRGRLRRHGRQGHHHPDHRQGGRGDDRVVQPAAGPGLPGGVHRRDRGQGPRRAGRRTGPSTSPSGSPCNGERDILGLWAGDGGEGAKFWLQVLTEIKNRGVQDVCMLVCDGLKGLPDSVAAVWPLTIVQTCIIHLLRNTFRYAGRQDWEKIAKDLQAGLYRSHRGGRRGTVRGVRQHLGRPLPGDRAAMAQRLGRVRAVPGVHHHQLSAESLTPKIGHSRPPRHDHGGSGLRLTTCGQHLYRPRNSPWRSAS